MSLEGGWGRFGLRPLAALLPHEETIPAEIKRVSDELLRDAMQRDPLIVDAENGVVLDGMHRLAALSRLGLQYAVCFSVDYGSARISVRRWARVYTLPTGRGFAGAVENAGLSQTSSVEAINSLETRRRPVAALSHSKCYVAKEGDLETGLGMVRALDIVSESSGWKRTFVPEDEIDVPLQEERNLVVLVARLRKSDVISAARRKVLFPCKTSMHVLDPRPVGVNVPLDELRDGSKKTIESRLRSPHKLLPANSSHGGRRYKERLVVFGPS